MDPVLKNKPPVVMLANTHKPFDTRIYQKEAASLYAHGYDVTIIVPHHESLTVDGIRIIGVPVPKNGWQQLFTCQWQILRIRLYCYHRVSKQVSGDYIIIFLFTEETKFTVIIVRRY